LFTVNYYFFIIASSIIACIVASNEVICLFSGFMMAVASWCSRRAEDMNVSGTSDGIGGIQIFTLDGIGGIQIFTLDPSDAGN